jgi:uncharacterized protein YjbJ (UPF0337 family)
MEQQMNIDTLAGEGTDLKGRFKSSLGDATGDPGLQRDGAADQVSGNVRKAIGALRDFARNQPLVAAAAAGLFGFALLKGRGGRFTR